MVYSVSLKGRPATCHWRQREWSRGIVLPIGNLGTRRGWAFSSRRWLFHHRERDSVPILEENYWTLSLVRTSM